MSHRYLSTARTTASVVGALVLAAAGLAGATPASAAYIVPPTAAPTPGRRCRPDTP